MDQSTNRAYLLIGGNMGDRLALLQSASGHISRLCGPIMAASAVYETAAWGKTDQASFLNQALAIDTALSPLALLQQVLEIEQMLGRVRTEKYGPRFMDIDIILYNQEVIATEGLTIPHPHMAARRFVLAPICEIAPELVHPVFGVSLQQLLEQCTDAGNVYKL